MAQITDIHVMVSMDEERDFHIEVTENVPVGTILKDKGESFVVTEVEVDMDYHGYCPFYCIRVERLEDMENVMAGNVH